MATLMGTWGRLPGRESTVTFPGEDIETLKSLSPKAFSPNFAASRQQCVRWNVLPGKLPMATPASPREKAQSLKLPGRKNRFNISSPPATRRLSAKPRNHVRTFVRKFQPRRDSTTVAEAVGAAGAAAGVERQSVLVFE